MDYDSGAGVYADHRRAHPGVLEALRGCVAGGVSSALEVGCGTGNFIKALAPGLSGAAVGVEPSRGMLSAARSDAPSVEFVQGAAEFLPFRQNCFDLVFSVDVIHHVPNPAAYFRDVHRVLRSGGMVCTATDSAWIIQHREPLANYFPETVDADLARYPAVVDLRKWMAEAGFSDPSEETVEHAYPLQDASAYESRAFSVLHRISDDAFERGLRRLKADLANGPVRCVSRYVFLWGVSNS